VNSNVDNSHSDQNSQPPAESPEKSQSFHTQKSDKLNDKKVTCSEHIINTLKQANQALNYLDFGNLFTYGTLRNEMSKHAKNGGVLRLLNECPGRFILPEWAHRPEYYCVIRNNKKGRVGRFDYLSYLASLGWGSVLAVHDLKLSFAVY